MSGGLMDTRRAQDMGIEEAIEALERAAPSIVAVDGRTLAPFFEAIARTLRLTPDHIAAACIDGAVSVLRTPVTALEMPDGNHTLEVLATVTKETLLNAVLDEEQVKAPHSA